MVGAIFAASFGAGGYLYSQESSCEDGAVQTYGLVEARYGSIGNKRAARKMMALSNTVCARIGGLGFNGFDLDNLLQHRFAKKCD